MPSQTKISLPANPQKISGIHNTFQTSLPKLPRGWVKRENAPFGFFWAIAKYDGKIQKALIQPQNAAERKKFEDEFETLPKTTKSPAKQNSKKRPVDRNGKYLPYYNERKQTGTSSLKHDNKRAAKKPGWRKSASGRWYCETRKNRSDSNNEDLSYSRYVQQKAKERRKAKQ